MTYKQGVVIIAVSIQAVVKFNTNGVDTMTYGYCRISTKKQNIERYGRHEACRSKPQYLLQVQKRIDAGQLSSASFSLYGG